MKDLIILGNGMAGMTAALYAKRANLDFKIVGRDSMDFGQISNAILVENYPCVKPMSGFELGNSLLNQLIDNEIYIEEKEIVRVSQHINSTNEDYNWKMPFYIVEYQDGTYDYAKAVIYALGARHRQLDCKIEEGIPIHYCALCDGALYKDKTVAIIGGGDVAFTQAEYLSKICKQVIIVMCDKNVTAAFSTFERVKKIPNITIFFNRPITNIWNGTNGFYKIYYEGTQRAPMLAEGIFVAIGMIPNTEPIDISGVVNKDGYISAIDTGICTLRPGFFAAGDCRTKMTRQALTAASDGANAVNSAIKYLRENSQ